jgi:hypothetical protein
MNAARWYSWHVKFNKKKHKPGSDLYCLQWCWRWSNKPPTYTFLVIMGEKCQQTWQSLIVASVPSSPWHSLQVWSTARETVDTMQLTAWIDAFSYSESDSFVLSFLPDTMQLTAWIDAFSYSESDSFVLSFLPRQQECFAQINYVIVVKWISLVRVLTLN